MDWYESEVRDLETRIDHNANGGRTAFYGSSSIRMWESIAQDLQSRCVLNLGFGGSTLAACVHFYDRIVAPVRPRSLVVYAGDNDLGDGRSAEDVIQSFRALEEKVARTQNGQPFGFISIKPSPARWSILPAIRKTNEAIQALIGSRPGGFYVDVFSLMLDKRGRPRPDLFGEDGLHMNRHGYEVWINALHQHRNRLFTVPCPDGNNGSLS